MVSTNAAKQGTALYAWSQAKKYRNQSPRNLCINPLDSKEIKPVDPKINQPWTFIGRTDAESPILWLSDVESWLIRKDPDDGKDRREQEKDKDATEDEMVGW